MLGYFSLVSFSVYVYIVTSIITKKRYYNNFFSLIQSNCCQSVVLMKHNLFSLHLSNHFHCVIIINHQKCRTFLLQGWGTSKLKKYQSKVRFIPFDLIKTHKWNSFHNTNIWILYCHHILSLGLKQRKNKLSQF